MTPWGFLVSILEGFVAICLLALVVVVARTIGKRTGKTP